MFQVKKLLKYCSNDEIAVSCMDKYFIDEYSGWRFGRSEFLGD